MFHRRPPSFPTLIDFEHEARLAALFASSSIAPLRVLYPFALCVGVILGFGLGLGLGSVTNALGYYVVKETALGALGGISAPLFLRALRYLYARQRAALSRPLSYLLYYVAGALAGLLMIAATWLLPARLAPGWWLIFYPLGSAGIFPVIGLVADFVQEQRNSHERTKEIFSKYVSESIARRILSAREPIALEGEKRQATVLISDIREFAKMIRERGAEEVVQTLNEYFTQMIDLIFEFDGTVNKFIGDAIVVLYGAPLALGNENSRAIETARAMQRAVREMNRGRAARNLPPLRIGIAIDVGEVVVGNIGSPRRLEYTAIGTPVNTAYFLAGIAPADTIYITENVYRALAPTIPVHQRETITMKSGAGDVTIYTLDDADARDAPPNVAPDLVPSTSNA